MNVLDEITEELLACKRAGRTPACVMLPTVLAESFAVEVAKGMGAAKHGKSVSADAILRMLRFPQEFESACCFNGVPVQLTDGGFVEVIMARPNPSKTDRSPS